jgi:hypothetical protein
VGKFFPPEVNPTPVIDPRYFSAEVSIFSVRIEEDFARSAERVGISDNQLARRYRATLSMNARLWGD